MRQAGERNLILIVVTVLGVVASSIVLVGGLQASESAAASFPSITLPPGCTKPADGFLVIASKYGYNDSLLEGAGPSKPWPVITVTQGQMVNITVCNVDTTESHGFQVSTYFDNTIESIAPNQVLHVSFIANKTGTFQIYCAIFCFIHIFMEYGQLRVLS